MFKYFSVILLSVFLSSFILVSCSDNSAQNQLQKISLLGKTMGTRYHITLIVDQQSSDALKHVKTDINNLLSDINHKMSTYLKNSEISRFNQEHTTKWFSVSTQLLHVVKAAQKISQESGGAFDITAASLVNLWGFGPTIRYNIPDSSQIKTALEQTGYQLIATRDNPPALRKLKPLVSIDLSAIAKGYAVDQISQYLYHKGIGNHLVEIGGEIVAMGYNMDRKPWHIAIENPAKNNLNKQLIKLHNFAVATSGDYRNFFIKSNKRYSHTIDPKTGKPVANHLASVTLLDKSAMKADALATALMVMGEKTGINFVTKNNIPALFIIRKGNNSFRYWSNLTEYDGL